MKTSEFALELAAQRVDQERDRGVARARFALAGNGSDTCEDCGRPIPAARRRVAPFATRCVDCQARHEREFA